jgi:hypothetical protein
MVQVTRNDPLDCGCTVQTRIREQHVYGETTDDWCTDHETWHAAEHHEFSAQGEICAVCQNAQRWHVNSAPAAGSAS